MRKCYVCKEKIAYSSRGSRCRECDKKYQMKRRMEKERECSKCKEFKKTSEFYKKKNGRYESYCRECKNEHRRQKYHERRSQMEKLMVSVGSCKHCLFCKMCREIVKTSALDDPPCFVSSSQHSEFIRYARNRADARVRV